MREVREAVGGDPAVLFVPSWAEGFPWLLHGTTVGRSDRGEFDLGLHSGGSPEEEVRRNWSRLRDSLGGDAIVYARQVHGCEVRSHGPLGQAPGDAPGIAGGPGMVGDCDGHVTVEEGLLLAVTTADCVPVFLVDPGTRAVGVLHAGWRGAASGVLEEGLRRIAGASGADPSGVHVHLGPAICGSCYEVGPEVFEALGEAPPGTPAPIDLRAVLARRARRAGVRPERLTLSEHCTRCTDSGLFSHRGGDAGRQASFVGIRR